MGRTGRFRGVTGASASVVALNSCTDRERRPLRFGSEWHDRFPDARQVKVPRGFHFPMSDRPDLVAHTIAARHREAMDACP